MEANLKGYYQEAKEARPEDQVNAMAQGKAKAESRAERELRERKDLEKAILKDAKQQFSLAQFRPAPGRPKTKKRKDTSEGERFLEMKDALLKDLQNGKRNQITPKRLKQMIEERQRNSETQNGTKGTKLWLEILLRRGELRDKAKKKAKVTVKDNIACYEYQDGLHFELPAGFRFGKGLMDKKLEIFIED